MTWRLILNFHILSLLFTIWGGRGVYVFGIYIFRCTRAVRKVSSHFEYLQNRSRDLDVTWQPVRDFTAHPWTLSRGASQSAVRRRWLSLCTVTVAFRMTERANQLHHNAPAHSTALVQAFCVLAKHHLTQVCQPPYSPDLAPCDFWLFPKLKSPLKGRRFMNAAVTQYTSSVNGVSLPTV